MALEAYLERIATLPIAVVAFAVMLGSTYLLGRLNPSDEIEKSIDVPYVSIGMTFGYKADDFYRMLDSIDRQPNGQELKEKYRRFFYYDLIYPWVLALAGAILIAYLQHSYNETHAVGMHYLWALPIVAAVFDNAENISMLNFLSRYDGKPMDTLLGFSRLMTMLKLIFIYAYWFVILYLGIVKLRKVVCKLVCKPEYAQPPIK
jgi:hypothetical protein